MNSIPPPDGRPQGGNAPQPFDPAVFKRLQRVECLVGFIPAGDLPDSPGLALDAKFLKRMHNLEGWTRRVLMQAARDAEKVGVAYLLSDAEGRPVLYARPPEVRTPTQQAVALVRHAAALGLPALSVLGDLQAMLAHDELVALLLELESEVIPGIEPGAEVPRGPLDALVMDLLDALDAQQGGAA